MIQQQTVLSTGNKIIAVKADTVCIHSDGAHAVQFAKLIFTTLKENNIAINPL